jgi:hypothetical protein
MKKIVIVPLVLVSLVFGGAVYASNSQQVDMRLKVTITNGQKFVPFANQHVLVSTLYGGPAIEKVVKTDDLGYAHITVDQKDAGEHFTTYYFDGSSMQSGQVFPGCRAINELIVPNSGQSLAPKIGGIDCP